jgi:hypothetical protein
MTAFQSVAMLLAAAWLALVVIRFRRSTLVLLIGLIVIGLFTLVALLAGQVQPEALGLGAHHCPAFGFIRPPVRRQRQQPVGGHALSRAV